MYCFSSSFCSTCLKHYPNGGLLDINKNKIKNMKIVEVLKLCGIDTNYCDDSYQVYICEKCIRKVEPFYRFKEKCSKNFMKLKGYVQKLKSNANVVFHADLKVTLSVSDNNEPIEYMDVSQFVETQIQMDEAEPQEIVTLPTNQDDKQQLESEDTIITINDDDDEEETDDIENNSEYQISNFVYENHFMNCSASNETVECDSNETVEFESNNTTELDDFASYYEIPSTVHSVSKTLHQCKICDKLNFSSTQLSLHTFLHTLVTLPDNETNKNMKYYCVLCTLHITEFANIKEHLLKHTLDTLYICRKCKAEFISYKEYKRHFVLNDTHKPFVCKPCKSGFFSQSHLRNHINKLHDITCLFCKNKFKNKTALDKHMIEKHNNRVCNICCTSFNSNDKLKQHLLDNHFDLHTVGLGGVYSYNCSKCLREFQTKYSLNEHLVECKIAKPKSKIKKRS